jgi:hypothetical protein
LKSFFLANRGLAETTISGGLLLLQLLQLLRQLLHRGTRETLVAGEMEEVEALATGDTEALAVLEQAEALAMGEVEDDEEALDECLQYGRSFGVIIQTQ